MVCFWCDVFMCAHVWCFVLSFSVVLVFTQWYPDNKHWQEYTRKSTALKWTHFFTYITYIPSKRNGLSRYRFFQFIDYIYTVSMRCAFHSFYPNLGASTAVLSTTFGCEVLCSKATSFWMQGLARGRTDRTKCFYAMPGIGPKKRGVWEVSDPENNFPLCWHRGLLQESKVYPRLVRRFLCDVFICLVFSSIIFTK